MGSTDTADTCIGHAQIVLPCADVPAMLAFLAALGFRMDMIVPADAPTTAVVSGHGVCLRLRQQALADAAPFILRLEGGSTGASGGECETLTPPPGLRLEWSNDAAPPALVAIPAHGIVTRDRDSAWHIGRAGMHYRDLLPGRMDGHFIASHIRIPHRGEVPDVVHHHGVNFQMIYCKAGWVRVVYEDQGEPFVMRAGDCVLQPPHIRHRVLDASPALEVIEIGSPAVHKTFGDANLPLPNGTIDPARCFAGQRFVRHIAASSPWQADLQWPGAESRDTGIAAATAGLADVRVLRSNAAHGERAAIAATRLHLLYVLGGSLRVVSDTLGEHTLREGDCCALPAGAPFRLQAAAASTWLQVLLPASPP